MIDAGAQERQPRHAARRFLRKTSLDELPQFINVLQGRMSIVGPRPHAVAHNELYRQLIKSYMVRHKVKPGITGWAQVNGFRGETDSLEKMEGAHPLRPRLPAQLVAAARPATSSGGPSASSSRMASAY